jgi:stress-induced morphogen
MDLDQLQKTCEQLTKALTPVRVEILELSQRSFTLRVVSNRFQGMSILERSNLLSNLFENQATQVVREYLFDFELWTEAEFASLNDPEAAARKAQEADTQRKIAAQGLDL